MTLAFHLLIILNGHILVHHQYRITWNCRCCSKGIFAIVMITLLTQQNLMSRSFVWRKTPAIWTMCIRIIEIFVEWLLLFCCLHISWRPWHAVWTYRTHCSWWPALVCLYWKVFTLLQSMYLMYMKLWEGGIRDHGSEMRNANDWEYHKVFCRSL